MGIDSIVSGVGPDIFYYLGGEASDSLSTYIGVRKYSCDIERNAGYREGMKQRGPGKHLLEKFVWWLPRTGVLVGSLYGLDFLLGIENNLINFHHSITYGLGSIKYLAAAHNLAEIYGLKTASKVFGIIPKTFSLGMNKLWQACWGEKLFE